MTLLRETQDHINNEIETIKRTVGNEVLDTFLDAYSAIQKITLETVYDTIMISTKFEFHEAMLDTLIDDEKKKFEQNKQDIEDEQAQDANDVDWWYIGKNEALLGMKITQQRNEYDAKVNKITAEIKQLKDNASKEINGDWTVEKAKASQYIVDALKHASDLVDTSQGKILSLRKSLPVIPVGSDTENLPSTPTTNPNAKILQEISSIKHRSAKTIVDTLYQAALKVKSMESYAQNKQVQERSAEQVKEALVQITIKQDEAKFVQEISDIVSKSQADEAAANLVSDSALADSIEGKEESDIIKKNNEEKATIAFLEQELKTYRIDLKDELSQTMDYAAKSAGKLVMDAEKSVKKCLEDAQVEVEILEKQLKVEEPAPVVPTTVLPKPTEPTVVVPTLKVPTVVVHTPEVPKVVVHTPEVPTVVVHTPEVPTWKMPTVTVKVPTLKVPTVEVKPNPPNKMLR